MSEAQSPELPDPLISVEPLVLRPGDILIVSTSHGLTHESAARMKRDLTERLGHVPIILSGVDEMAVYRPDRIALAEETPPAPAHTYTVHLRDSRAPYRIDADLCGRHGSEYLFTAGEDREPVARVAADTVASIHRNGRAAKFPHRGHVAGRTEPQG